MGISRAPSVVLITAAAAATFAAAALADTVTDKQKDNPSSTVDINVASVEIMCKPRFTVTVLPQNALKRVEPTSGALPGIQIDRDGNGRPDRLVGQPKGKGPGVYTVSGTRIGKRVATAVRTVDPGQGYYVTWDVPYTSVVKAKKIRWRAVSRSAVTGSLDRAPDRFRATRFTAICP